MHWNEREGNQKEKIIKNGNRWGQILCSGKRATLLLHFKWRRDCVYVFMHISSMEEKVFRMLFKIACFFTLSSANTEIY